MILFLIGVFGGILAGLLGIGGGVVFIAVLPTFLQQAGIPEDQIASYTITNSLFGTFFSGASSVISQQFNQKDKSLPYGRAVITGLTAALLALLCFWLVVSQPWYSKSIFSLVVVVLLTLLLARALYSLYGRQPEAIEAPAPKPGFLASVGAISGLVSSLSGMGGGVVIVPALRYIGHYPVYLANFVSSFTIATASLAAILFALLQDSGAGPWGYLIPSVSGPLAMGVLVGAPVGVRLMKRLSSTTITWLYCIFVGAVLVKYLYTFLVG